MRRAEIGDEVLILSSPETLATGHAGRMGTCHGFTTPSVTGVPVIGEAAVDAAVNVSFGDGTSAWFDPALVEFVDVRAGQVMTIGDRRFVRAPDGAWIDESEPS